jgi:methylmalonyl-CoA mutase
MATDDLLQEFPPVSTASWEEIIRKDLKGADYAKKLIWQTDEGLAVKPYYRAEDIAGLTYLDAPPGVFPFARSDRPTGDWHIREEIDATDPENANQAARHAIASGAEEVAFLNTSIKNASDLGIVLAKLQDVPVHFQNADRDLLRLLIETKKSEKKNLSPTSTGLDPLANLDFAAEVLATAAPTLIPFTVHGSEFEESGATAVQEVGFTLAAGIDFLAEMQTRNVDINRAASALTFSFAIGSNYFFQIAKLRAFRMLWAQAVSSFGGTQQSAKARIHARTSRWNKTVYDPHVNILRSTTEAMSAALGGADSISVAAFDECYKNPDEASQRLARNTQIILKQEAQLARVADPGGGSYALEVITYFIAREAWKIMQTIEAAGGFQKACAEGQIARALEQSLAARDKAVGSRRRIFTGTNQYANLSEKALERIDCSHSDLSRQNGAHRGAQPYEQLRLRTERYAARMDKLPRILLAEIGDAKMRAARSNFATNFFGCAGFDIVTRQFDSVDEIAELAQKDAEMIVLCSSDQECAALVTALMTKLTVLGRKIPVIIAGYPDSSEQLKATGVADFIHIRTNPIEFLTKWQQQLGIKD